VVSRGVVLCREGAGHALRRRARMEKGRVSVQEPRARYRQAKKNAAEAALKDLETSLDEGITSRSPKHSPDNSIDSLRIAQ
jgi:hypothetical protein